MYFHTLRHLRLSQICWLVRQGLPRRQVQPPKHDGLRSAAGHWKSGPTRAQSLFEDGRVSFLEVEGKITGASGWANREAGMLWLYNLHYFDDLSSGPSTSDSRRALQGEWVSRWIAENPQGSQPGWDPYPTALRIVNWVRASLEGFQFSPEAIDSLALQANHLRNRLEHHLLANHLWADAKGLVFAGLFLQGKAAGEWLKHGLSLLREQVMEQILDDGGHFERSPMYHAIIHEDLLDLIQILQVYGMPVPEGWQEAAEKMGLWSQLMLHPDGDIPFFNDAAFGIAASHEDRIKYSRCLGVEVSDHFAEGIVSLPDSGYFRIKRGDFLLLCDAAEVGPDYQPGHAHADTLSFELSYRGERFFVNTGTSCYGDSSRRELERSSFAHNTVRVDGKDSSEVWGGFRVARRAKVINTSASDDKECSRLLASHDGYARLRRKQVHTREWFVHHEQVTVEDHLEHMPQQEAVASFHLAPWITVEESGAHAVWLTSESGNRLLLEAEGATISIEDFSWASRFGLLTPSKVLRIALVGQSNAVRLTAESLP